MKAYLLLGETRGKSLALDHDAGRALLPAGWMLRAISHLLDIGAIGVLERRLSLDNARHSGEVALASCSVI